MYLCYVMWSNIMWKSVKLNFGQLSLNLTYCAVPQTESEPSIWTRFYTRAVRFVLSSLKHNCYNWKVTAARNWYSWPSAAWDATDTQQFWKVTAGRNWYTAVIWKVTAGRNWHTAVIWKVTVGHNWYSDIQQPGTQLVLWHSAAWDATDTLTFSRLGRNWYSDIRQPGTQLILWHSGAWDATGTLTFSSLGRNWYTAIIWK